MAPPRDAFLVTCEHGGNRIPAACRTLFTGQQALLESHRGFDAGALTMARALGAAFDAPLVASTVSRLVVDLNRSPGHRRLFSAPMRAAPKTLRADVLAQHYVPYRTRVENLVRQFVADGRRVIHVSSHSFTPVLDGRVRGADVGLLFDPGRPGEAELCAQWKAAFAATAPGLRVRRNHPYAGRDDGLTSYLRRLLPPTAYIGIELELNQRFVLAGGRPWRALRRDVITTLHRACEGWAPPHERAS
jgi:predicted N-formylglutamate amidohydrolase